MSNTFAQLGVPPFICDALERRGIVEPFEIQAATVADALADRDVLGRAPTGSGKTIAFGVPLVAVVDRAEPHRPSALVLAPTRELAEQITTELRTFSGRLRVDAVYGGVGYGKQLEALRRGVDILVACPGRLEDLIARGDVDLSGVDRVVLDEADRMADMGFMPVVKRLLDQTSSERQTMLFSATLDGEVAKLVERYQRDPARHEVGDETPDVTAATHRFFNVERLERNPLVGEVINAAWPSIVFTRTRHGADRLARQLRKLGFEAAPIHGGLSQRARQRALDDFSGGRVHALIATDVAARGIHVDGVASVVHYDPPEDHTTYIHRSGRTARAGADGLVVSLVQPDQAKAYRRMQRDVGIDEPFGEYAEGCLPEQTERRELAPPAPSKALAKDGAAATTRDGQHSSRRREGGHRSRSNQRRRNDRSDRNDRNASSGERSKRRANGPGQGRQAAQGERSGDAGDRPRRANQDRARRSGSRTPSSSDSGATRGSKHAAANDVRSSAPKANNRKARRAHLQPKAR